MPARRVKPNVAACTVGYVWFGRRQTIGRRPDTSGGRRGKRTSVVRCAARQLFRGWLRKKRIISAVASGPAGSAKLPPAPPARPGMAEPLDLPELQRRQVAARPLDDPAGPPAVPCRRRRDRRPIRHQRSRVGRRDGMVRRPVDHQGGDPAAACRRCRPSASPRRPMPCRAPRQQAGRSGSRRRRRRPGAAPLGSPPLRRRPTTQRRGCQPLPPRRTRRRRQRSARWPQPRRPGPDGRGSNQFQQPLAFALRSCSGQTTCAPMRSAAAFMPVPRAKSSGSWVQPCSMTISGAFGSGSDGT